MDLMASRVASTLFVGCRGELEAIATALRTADAGQRSTLLIAGEAGVGKTRHVAEAAAAARASGWRILAGARIALADGAFPFAPLVEAFRDLPAELLPTTLEQLDRPAPWELARLIPVLVASEERAGAADADMAHGRVLGLVEART